jgi:hypothetical protein
MLLAQPQQWQQQQRLLQGLTGGGPLRVLVVLPSLRLTAVQRWHHLRPAHPPAQLAARLRDGLQQQQQQQQRQSYQGQLSVRNAQAGTTYALICSSIDRFVQIRLRQSSGDRDKLHGVCVLLDA